MGWSNAARERITPGVGWSNAARERITPGVGWSNAARERITPGVGWSNAARERITPGVGWSNATRERITPGVGWSNAARERITPGVGWSNAVRVRITPGVGWSNFKIRILTACGRFYFSKYVQYAFVYMLRFCVFQNMIDSTPIQDESIWQFALDLVNELLPEIRYSMSVRHMKTLLNLHTDIS